MHFPSYSAFLTHVHIRLIILLVKFSIDLSNLDKILVISTHQPGEIDYKTLFKSVPTNIPITSSNASFTGPTKTPNDLEDPILSSEEDLSTTLSSLESFTETSSNINETSFINSQKFELTPFDALESLVQSNNQSKLMLDVSPSEPTSSEESVFIVMGQLINESEYYTTQSSIQSSTTDSSFSSPYVDNTGGPFLIVDPQIDLNFFNTNTVQDIIEEATESDDSETTTEQPNVVQTTDMPLDYVITRDVFIPQQSQNSPPSILASFKDDAITMDYDMARTNEVDYAYDENYAEPVPLYQDESGLQALDSSNNLYRIEIEIPGNIQRDKLNSNFTKLLLADMKEDGTINGKWGSLRYIKMFWKAEALIFLNAR